MAVNKTGRISLWDQGQESSDGQCPCFVPTANPLPNIIPSANSIRDLVSFTINTAPPDPINLALGQIQHTLQSLLISGFEKPFDHTTDNAKLLDCVELLDQYFFHHTLTRPSSDFVSSDSFHHLEDGIFPAGAVLSSKRNWVHLTVNIPDMSAVSGCFLSSSRVRALITVRSAYPLPSGGVRPVGLAAAIEGLIHEMVHAYLLVFGCDRREDCLNRKFKNGDRRDWHGRHLHKLLTHVYETIQEWHISLSDFGLMYKEDREYCC
ncbi:hypothetical protein BN1708_009454 [Verticillium longisporum]|uniref:SprT-like domain-containing protein n=1 Tax=Verticillium longisporum TaxID=100787 RepID=A0A0G4KHI0_VERLO|nr:hypothetical protein BN1708_009454 [Verticillium longisporum]